MTHPAVATFASELAVCVASLAAPTSPVRLVTGDEPARPPHAPADGGFPWMWVGVAGVVAIGCALGFLAARRVDMERKPGEYAFARARRILGLPWRSGTVLRKLASAHSGASPAALLVSGHALGLAAAEHLRRPISSREREEVELLCKRMGVPIPAPPPPQSPANTRTIATAERRARAGAPKDRRKTA